MKCKMSRKKSKHLGDIIGKDTSSGGLADINPTRFIYNITALILNSMTHLSVCTNKHISAFKPWYFGTGFMKGVLLHRKGS